MPNLDAALGTIRERASTTVFQRRTSVPHPVADPYRPVRP